MTSFNRYSSLVIGAGALSQVTQTTVAPPEKIEKKRPKAPSKAPHAKAAPAP